jgi:hypothetical protein
MKEIITPYQALQRPDGDYYVALYWRHFPISEKCRNVKNQGFSGKLCSLRYTSMRCKKNALCEEEFIYSHFLSLLDAAQDVTNSEYTRLHTEKVDGMNIIFAVAEFENGMAAEFELNEELPDTMQDICFVKGNYSDGHVTNQPVVGYFNEEGLICADENGMSTLIAENGASPAAEGPFGWMKLRFDIKLERGLIAPGKQNIEKLAALIKRSLGQ